MVKRKFVVVLLVLLFSCIAVYFSMYTNDKLDRLNPFVKEQLSYAKVPNYENIDEILSKTTFCNFSCKINNVLLYKLKILSYFCKKITVWMKPKSNGQETKTQKTWSRSQGQEEIVKKPRPRRNGREKNGPVLLHAGLG